MSRIFRADSSRYFDRTALPYPNYDRQTAGRDNPPYSNLQVSPAEDHDYLPSNVLTATEVLEPTDVVRLQFLSRHFLTLTRDNNLWKTLCFHDSRAEAARRRQQLTAAQSPSLAALVQAMVALPRGPEAGHNGSTSRVEVQARQNTTRERTRALANWDPTYPGENFNFYQEYIQRHAPITESWFQTVRDGTGEERQLREATGIGVLYEDNEDRADKLIAPLDDGSICVWSMFLESGDDKSYSPGRVIGRSSTGLLTGKGPDAGWEKRLAQSKAMMTETGAVECVSIDRRQRRGYFAVQNYLNEVDLNTLRVTHREQYPFPITALSGARHPTPLTVGTNFTIHLHDPRRRSNFSAYDTSLRCELIGGTPPNDYFSHNQTGNRRHHSTLSQPGPLSILHLPEHSHDDNGAIWVAGRFTSLLHYDRRFFPRLCGTLHSSARLSCLASLPHPFIPREMDLLRNPSLPIAAFRAAKSVPGTTLLAVGEYKGKGSLELYGLPLYSSSTTHYTAHPTQFTDSRKTTLFYHNRQTASASKLLSVVPHGTRLVYSDANGYLRWVERDGVTPVRRHDINHDPNLPINHHATHPDIDGGSTHPATTIGSLFFTPTPTATSQAEGGDIVQKLIPTLTRSSTGGHSNNANQSLNHDNLLVWTGNGRLGMVGFGRSPAFVPDELEEQARSAEEAERMAEERTYGWAMRRALERQADEVRFVRGLGLGIGEGHR